VDVHHLAAQRVTEASFAPFGRVLGSDLDDLSRRVVGRFRNGQEPMPSIIHEINPDGVPSCGWLARHHDQTQALTPIDGPIVVVLVPPGRDPLAPDARAAAGVFVADVGEGIQLDEGVWHWAASVQRGSVRVANVQGNRWPDDNEVLSLDDSGQRWCPVHEWIDREWAADLLALGTVALREAHGARPVSDGTAAGGSPPQQAARLPAGGWVVTDDDGTVELDDAAVEEAVRSRP
jgi:ureidoglycolate hydrolase